MRCSAWGGCSGRRARLCLVSGLPRRVVRAWWGGPGFCLTALCSPAGAMWPVLWTAVRTYAPYVTFPVAFVVGAVGYHLEWFIRGKEPQPVEEEKSISERREERKLDELLGKDHTQVVSLKDKLEFAPKAVLNRNRPEKN